MHVNIKRKHVQTFFELRCHFEVVKEEINSDLWRKLGIEGGSIDCWTVLSNYVLWNVADVIYQGLMWETFQKTLLMI